MRKQILLEVKNNGQQFLGWVLIILIFSSFFFLMSTPPKKVYPQCGLVGQNAECPIPGASHYSWESQQAWTIWPTLEPRIEK